MLKTKMEEANIFFCLFCWPKYGKGSRSLAGEMRAGHTFSPLPKWAETASLFRNFSSLVSAKFGNGDGWKGVFPPEGLLALFWRKKIYNTHEVHLFLTNFSRILSWHDRWDVRGGLWPTDCLCSLLGKHG